MLKAIYLTGNNNTIVLNSDFNTSALQEKLTKEFADSIESGELYEQLKSKKSKKRKNNAKEIK